MSPYIPIHFGAKTAPFFEDFIKNLQSHRGMKPRWLSKQGMLEMEKTPPYTF